MDEPGLHDWLVAHQHEPHSPREERGKTWRVVGRDAIDRMKDTYCLVCAHTVRLGET